MKKLFAKLITPLAFVAAVIFAGCSNPSSSSASSSDVPRGSVIAATYSSEGGGGAQIVFNEDSTVVFLDNGGTSARAAVAFSEDKVCARGTYVITADNFAQITITEVLRKWGDISQDDLNNYKEGAFTVSFSGNELRITVEEKSLSFSTDNKNVSKPSGGTPPVQNGPLFSNGPVNATYLSRGTPTLQIKLSSDGDVKYYENDKLCWEGTYTIIDAENASVELNKNKIHVSGSFGTASGNLFITEADQESLCLDLLNGNLGESGGTSEFFVREK